MKSRINPYPLRFGWCITLLVIITLGAACAGGDEDYRDRFDACTYESPAGGKLLYRLLKPKGYDPSWRYPLVLFFHGAGERGDDNRRQLLHGMNGFASDKIMDAHPCFVVAPQCPRGLQWVDTPWSADGHTMPDKPTAPMRMALELVRQLQRDFSIDPSRIYVTGLSMGGFGTWDAIQRHPDWFAAAIPVCGGGDTAKAADIAHIPVWVFHGGSDRVVKTQRSRDMVAALKAAGGSPKYTEYPGVGHNSWSATYANPDVYTWLFSQHK